MGSMKRCFMIKDLLSINGSHDMKHKNTTKRITMLVWLVAPLLVTLTAVNYLFFPGKTAQTVIAQSINQQKSVLGAKSDQKKQKTFIWNGKGMVTFWFDDAWNSEYYQGYFALEQYNMVGALAVPTRLVGYEAYMDWPQIARLQYKGWEITSHSRTHTCDLGKLSQKDVLSELLGSKNDLVQRGLSVSVYVSPCGSEDDAMLTIIKQHYKAYRGVDPGINDIPVQDPYELLVHGVDETTTPNQVREWLNETESRNGWLILMVHQVQDKKVEYGTTPETFRQIVQLVAQSGLSIVTPSEALSVK